MYEYDYEYEYQYCTNNIVSIMWSKYSIEHIYIQCVTMIDVYRYTYVYSTCYIYNIVATRNGYMHICMQIKQCKYYIYIHIVYTARCICVCIYVCIQSKHTYSIDCGAIFHWDIQSRTMSPNFKLSLKWTQFC